jgi:hypothetical protein
MTIEKEDGTLIQIEPPFTLEFDIIRNILSSVNTGSFRIYNLNKTSRQFIRRDQFDFDNLKTIKLEAGYGDTMNEIYSGTISKAYSTRQGVNYIITIESEDGGWAEANIRTDKSYPAGTKNEDIIKDLVKQLKVGKVTQGKIGAYLGASLRGVAYSGPIMQILSEITGGGFFIDNMVAHVLNDKECIEKQILVINSETGLLGTPIRQQIYVTFDILLEPRLKIGQRIQLESTTLDDEINTQYKVMAVSHKGVISEVISGSSITSVTCLPGEFDEVS